MRLDKLKIPKEEASQFGLEEIDIRRLGSVVALVGRNGSGKSRILNAIEKLFPNEINCGKILDESISHLPSHIQRSANSLFTNNVIKSYFETKYKLIELQKNLNKDKGNIKVAEEYQSLSKLQSLNQNNNQVKSILNNAQATESNLSVQLNDLYRKSIRRINYQEIRDLQQKIEASKDQGLLTFESLIESVTEKENYNEFTSIHRTALDYLAKLPHQLVIDKDIAYGDSDKYELQPSFKRFNLLRKLMKDFLNKDLNWEKEQTKHSLTTDGVTTQSRGIWKLEGRLFNYLELSDGEKTLFAYCLLFFLLGINPRIKIKDCIIIIDEPELHLHPESELWLINGIRNVIKDSGQLWIATHSISILSSLSHDEIFMVKGSRIFPPDKSIPGRTLTELMGLEEHIERLEFFISDISKWAFVNFMSQCFVEPEVVRNAQPGDPEVEVFFKSIALNPNASILLDFGAGQGRVIKEIQPNVSNLNYYALEPSVENHAELRNANATAIYSNYTELPENTFDYVLVCNVLHEIPVSEWANTLNSIKRSLKETGYLILIEDLKLPKGEKVEKNGFVILDEESFELIVSATKKTQRIYPTNEKYKDRILCIPVLKSNIGEITKDSIVKGLQKLKENTFDLLKKTRSLDNSGSERLAHGRIYAFYSQLYINTIFAIESIDK